MPNDEEKAAGFARWRDAMGIKPICPACKSQDWIFKGLVALPEILDDGKLSELFASFRSIMCDKCGYVMLFLAAPSSELLDDDD